VEVNVLPPLAGPFHECFVLDPFCGSGGVSSAFVDLVKALSPLHNSHALFLMRTEGANDPNFVFAVARELPEMLERGIDATVGKLHAAFQAGQFTGRLPTSLVIGERRSDLRVLVGDEGASFISTGEAYSLPWFLETAATIPPCVETAVGNPPYRGPTLHRMKLWDRAAANVVHHLFDVLRMLNPRCIAIEIPRKDVDFSTHDGGADALYSVVSDRFLLVQVKGSSSGNAFSRSDMEKETMACPQLSQIAAAASWIAARKLRPVLS
jgi:hypothetical protein